MIQTALRALFLLIIPLAGLALLWAQSEDLSRQGTDWEVPVMGYDPRDLLRGHYVEFRYDWPIRADQESEGENSARGGRGFTGRVEHLCLIGDPPVIAEALVFDDPTDPLFEQCEHKLSVQPGSVYGYSSVLRGRLYVGQDRALELEKGLRERGQRGIVTFRQREDGTITPLSIRFRPLTPEEEEERGLTRADEMSVVGSARFVVTSSAPESEETQAPSEGE